MYSIYKITSPSGKYYIGLTKNPISDRWRQHVKRAFTEHRNHPFYNAIRKYGPDSFDVQQIDSARNKSEAQEKERYWIAQSPEDLLYNLSPGGETDGEVGGHIFWENIRKDPERLKVYLNTLSKTKRENDWSDYQELSKKAAEWRKQHPKEAYKIARRASRIAARKNPTKAPDPELPLKERLRRKYKKADRAREYATQQWSSRTEEQRAEVARKIAESSKKTWAQIIDPKERSKKTEIARNSIDRTKQGPAASKGLKRFWEDLKADPEKYKEYMERRTASLNETLRKKNR